jgi:hypothetical protein
LFGIDRFTMSSQPEHHAFSLSINNATSSRGSIVDVLRPKAPLNLRGEGVAW